MRCEFQEIRLGFDSREGVMFRHEFDSVRGAIF